MKVFIEYQNQFKQWVPFQQKNNEADAYRVASRRAASTNKRHRLKDEKGRILDIID